MVLWVLLALMTGAAVLAVLWPLSKLSPPGPDGGHGDVAFYRDQLAEIERDRQRGLIGEREAEAARIESGRRLLRAKAAPEPVSDATSEPALRRRRAASALALCVVPIVALVLYGTLGSPRLPAQPIEARIAGQLPSDAASALARIEDHLAQHPEDGRGWDIIAPVYLRIGRYDDAARAYANARRVAGDTIQRLLGHGEALVSAGEGVVSAQAAGIFRSALALEPSSAAARYYLALAAEQDGDRGAAENAYRAILAGAPANAPWIAIVQARLSHLSGQPAASAAIPPAAVTPEIAAMVSGLDKRLRSQGGSEAEWSRLVRSLVVLGRRDDALDRLEQARTILAGDAAGLARLDRLAHDLGLTSAVANR